MGRPFSFRDRVLGGSRAVNVHAPAIAKDETGSGSIGHNIGDNRVYRHPRMALLAQFISKRGSVIPNVGSVIAILIGAALGSFAGKYVFSLFYTKLQRRDPLIGATALALLSIAYSFPLYSDAISDLLSQTGLSTVKTPFLELTLRERGSKSFTGPAGARVTSEQIPRPGDPKPGLEWLKEDTGDGESNTFEKDKAYITFAKKNLLAAEDYKKYDNELKDVKNFLKPAQVLSVCLHKYVEALPDFALLLVDIKPVIELLFLLHWRAKQDTKNANLTYIIENKKVEFWSEVKGVLKDVEKKINYPGTNPDQNKSCDGSKISDIATEPMTINYLEPYITLVLSDLLIARGSKDEAIGVLAEWLTLSTGYQDTHPDVAGHTPEWFQLRVASRITLLERVPKSQNW